MAGSSQRWSPGIAFIVQFGWGCGCGRGCGCGCSCGCGITPLRFEWLFYFLRRAELKVAYLLGDGGALSNRLELGNKLGLEAAGPLWVQVTGLLWDINEGCDDLIVTFFSSLLSNTASSADLNGQFLTVGVSNKLARLHLNVLGGARWFIDSAALFGSLSIANLLKRCVAFLNCLIESLLFKGDLTGLFKVFLADFLLGRRVLCDVAVVTLLNILVCAFKDGVLLDAFDRFFLYNTAESWFGIRLASTEVNSSLDFNTMFAPLSTNLRCNFVGCCQCNNSE